MKTVLVIDRRTRTRYTLGTWLGANDRAIAVRDVFLAFRYLQTRRIDTVVVKTTSLDGVAIAVLKWLQLRGMEVPVVVLLGAAAAAEMPLIRSRGASAVLQWPTSRASLLEAVASVCAIGDSELRSQRAYPARM
jgi:DNA-binding NtrC family response regulator